MKYAIAIIALIATACLNGCHAETGNAAPSETVRSIEENYELALRAMMDGISQTVVDVSQEQGEIRARQEQIEAELDCLIPWTFKNRQVVTLPPMEPENSTMVEKTDPDPIVLIPELTEPEPTLAPDLSQYVYPIKCVSTNGRMTGNGSCVSLGGGEFLTAAHLAEGLGSHQASVQIDGEWREAWFTVVVGADLARVRVDGIELDGVEMRNAEYGESVTIYGLKTLSNQRGFCLGDDVETVALNAECNGIEKGDSGGAVFGSDGSLIGIISARTPNDGRIVYYESTGKLAPQTAQAKTQPPATTPAPSYSNCPNGQCYQQPRYSYQPRRYGRRR